MTEKEREAFYDAEIAPALKAMSEKCLANGLSFFSLVEWAPGETGQTTAFQPLEKRGLAITWCDWAAKANGSAHGIAKLNERQVAEIKRLLKEGVPQRTLARRFNVSQYPIKEIAKGRAWRHV